MGKYYISDAQRQSGPHEPIELRELWIAGELTDDALVRAAELDKWEPLIPMMPASQSEEGKLRQQNLRLIKTVELIEGLAQDVCYVDLEPNQRTQLADLFTEICRKPLDDWLPREKRIFKFWQALEPECYAQAVGEDTQTGISDQLKELIAMHRQQLAEARALRAENEKIKWAVRAAAIAIWLIISFGFVVVAKR